VDLQLLLLPTRSMACLLKQHFQVIHQHLQAAPCWLSWMLCCVRQLICCWTVTAAMNMLSCKCCCCAAAWPASQMLSCPAARCLPGLVKHACMAELWRSQLCFLLGMP
jgi:hypothetical protein